MIPNLQLLPGRTVVKQAEKKQVSDLIFLADNLIEKEAWGIVAATGAGTSLKDGDRVFFGNFSGQKFKLEGEEYLYLEDKEIMGVYL
jgi:co-chaperonin GroES (HSP10)